MKHDCNYCGKPFAEKGDLRRHIQSVHEGVKYACNQCDKQLSDQSKLTRQGVKYACKQCDKQFAEQYSLNKHIKYVHQGLKNAGD